MEVFLVGGAVRDLLLKRKSNDKDYVVVGSTVSEMLDKGFKQVGKEFPVFLHPETSEEYALARKEQRVGKKHGDFKFEFQPSTTLEDDLVRRDFTVNAMAVDKNHNIVDYFGGLDDLKNKLLKAVRPETFIEDALRVLRGARFSAQLEFDIEDSTKELFKNMVNSGDLNELTAERVWKETEKALSQGYDSPRYFEVLNECGALELLFPEVYALTKSKEQIKYHPSGNSFEHTLIALERVQNESSIVKFAVLCHDLGKGNTPKDILPKHSGHDLRGLPLIDTLCDRIKVPNAYREFAKLFCEEHMRFAKLNGMNLSKQYDIIKKVSKNFKSESALNQFLTCFSADWHGEYVKTEFNSEEDFNSIINRAKKIFQIMKNKSLNDLPQNNKDSLSRFSGKKYGECYRAFMIDYLRNNIEK